MIAHTTSDPSLTLTTSWIYELIQREVNAGDDDWKTMLRRKYDKCRDPRKGSGGVVLIPNRVDIDQCPADDDTRETFGHCECDTIIGAYHQGAIVTWVERRTRYQREP